MNKTSTRSIEVHFKIDSETWEVIQSQALKKRTPKPQLQNCRYLRKFYPCVSNESERRKILPIFDATLLESQREIPKTCHLNVGA